MSYKLTKEALAELLRLIERDSLIGVGQLSFDADTETYPNLNTYYGGLLDTGDFPGWTSPLDLTLYWTEAGLVKPVGYNDILALSRRAFKYGNVQVRAQLEDLSLLPNPPGSTPVIHFCALARGTGIGWGHASWVLNRNTVRVNANSLWGGVELNLTSIMPANIFTSVYHYSIKVNRNNIEFYLGTIGYAPRLRAIIITAPVASQYRLISEPYAITVLSCADFPTSLNVMLVADYRRQTGRENALTIPISPRKVRASDGDPCPPRVYRLYEEETDTLLAGSSVDPSVISHPFPLFGYEGKTINFMSDEAGNLDIEVLKTTGNWRTYSTTAVVANTLLTITIPDEEILGRVEFTPTLPPANILEAEVVLR